MRLVELFEAFNIGRVEQCARSVESELEGYDPDSAVRGGIEMPGDVLLLVRGEAA